MLSSHSKSKTTTDRGKRASCTSTPGAPAPARTQRPPRRGRAPGLRERRAPEPGLRTPSFLCLGFIFLPVFHFSRTAHSDHRRQPHDAAAFPGGLRSSHPGTAARLPRRPCFTGTATRPGRSDTHEGALTASPEAKRHRDRVGDDLRRCLLTCFLPA